MAAPAIAALGPVELVARSIESLLAAARQPVVLEPGDAAYALSPGQFHLERGPRWLRLEVWDETRLLNRRITALRAGGSGKLELITERFGGKAGSLFLYDEARPQNQALQRRSLHWTGAQWLEGFLRRRFAGWRLERLSQGADLEHSLSPAFPRAAVRKGQEGWAAMLAANEDDASRLLSFGLIWHDYLRRNWREVQMRGLALFVPEAAVRMTALRLRHLNPEMASFRLFAYDDAGAQEVDIADAGNVNTTLGAASLKAKPRLEPEAVLEASVRANLERLDARLLPEPVYSQVPGLTGLREGLFDLLAADRNGRLTLIELKASESVHLPVQALDYYIRTLWHLERGEFTRQGYFPGLTLSPAPPRILLAAPAQRFHSTNETVLGYFRPSIEVDVLGLGQDLGAPPRVLFRRRITGRRA